MIRSAIRSLVSRICEDPAQTRFAPTVYNEAIDLAQKQFAFDSKALFKDLGITMVAGTAAYPLPSDFMYEKGVVLNGIALQPISRATLEANKKSDRWDDDRGTPMYFIVDPEEARKTLTLYPIPDNVNDGTDIVLTYYPLPAEMSSDSSVPLNSSALMAQFHTGIANYAAWQLLQYITQTAEIAQKRAECMGIYSSKVAEAIQTFGTTKSEPLSFHVGSMRIR